MRTARCLLAVGVGSIVCLAGSNAVAETSGRTFVPVGLLLSATSHTGGPSSVGPGIEASWVHHPGRELQTFGYGAFLQAQSVGWFDHARVALGPQFSYSYFGVELGGSVETKDANHASTLGLHVAPFISLLGVVGIAFRVCIPVAALSGPERYPIDNGVVFTLKVPIPLDGKPWIPSGPMWGPSHLSERDIPNAGVAFSPSPSLGH
jgi:hypothetical protein